MNSASVKESGNAAPAVANFGSDSYLMYLWHRGYQFRSSFHSAGCEIFFQRLELGEWFEGFIDNDESLALPLFNTQTLRRFPNDWGFSIAEQHIIWPNSVQQKLTTESKDIRKVQPSCSAETTSVSDHI